MNFILEKDENNNEEGDEKECNECIWYYYKNS